MGKLTLRLFGPMQAFVDGQPLPRMRSRKALWTLAILALRHGIPITRERLAAMLWPDTPKEVALSNLRPLVSELRSALGGSGGPLQAPDRKTIALDLSKAEVDVLEFNAAIDKGDLEEAVALYKGPVIEDCDEEWILPEREAKEAACLAALHRLSQASLERGDFNSAVSFARQGIVVSPKADAPRRILMETLALSGDLNAALESYRDYERLVREERGGVPDAQTVELHQKLRSEGRTQPHGKAQSQAVIGDISHALDGLIGRENERVDLWSKIDRDRLVTLTGLGGIGKTRLARQLATDLSNRFSDGACVVALEAVIDGRLVVERVAIALRIRPEPQRALIDTIIDRLQAKKLLLVLDNCEHLLEACVELCGRILAGCQGVKILATSRQQLGIRGEQVWSVPALSYCSPESLPPHAATRLRVAASYEATQLFIQRALAVRSDFALSEANVAAVVQICAHVEGIPLAIELAASRVRSMTPEEISARLVVHHLGLLADPGSAIAPRQRTLRATLDWSYSLLSEPERIALQRLSVFRGGWTLEAAEQVVSDSESPQEGVADLLDSLVAKSMISFSDNGVRGRYEVLETVRQYAHEKLTDRESMQSKLGAWCLEFARKAWANYRGPDQAMWVDRVEAEHDNIRVVLEWSEREPLTRLEVCNAVGYYWWSRGLLRNCERYLTDALSQIEGKVPIAEHYSALHHLCAIAYERLDLNAGRTFTEEGLKLARETGDVKEMAVFLAALSLFSMYQGDFVQAKEEAQWSLELAREAKEPRSVRVALTNLGSTTHLLGEFNLARESFQEAYELGTQNGTSIISASILHCLASVHRDQGNYDVAINLYRDSIDLCRAVKAVSYEADAMLGLGHLQMVLGDYHSAAESFSWALTHYRQAQNSYSIANALTGLGQVDLAEGDLDVARQKIDEALSIFRNHAHDPGVARSLTALAPVLRAQGLQAPAIEALREALEIQLKLQAKWGLGANLLVVAEIAIDKAELAISARCLAIAESLRETYVWQWSPKRRQEIASLLQVLRKNLGAPAFDAYWAEACTADWHVAVKDLLPVLTGWIPAAE